jgi:hypothetical protein
MYCAQVRTGTPRSVFCEYIKSIVGFAILSALLLTIASGCGSKVTAVLHPKLRVEGPGGTAFGHSITYFDGKDNVDANGTVETIPASGVYTEDLKAGHQGILVQIMGGESPITGTISFDSSDPNNVKTSAPARSTATLTVILLDGSTELQRGSAKADQIPVQMKIGSIPEGMDPTDEQK